MSYGPAPWLQAHWDARAAANFVFGGAGSGLLVAWTLAGAASRPWPIVLALALMAAGLLAVWMEIGRKLRAVNVLFNPGTSWMTRESYAAMLVFPLGLGAIAAPQALWPLPAAALAALVFLWCQARILRAAKGIPAWRTRRIVPLVMASGLAEGAGLALLFADHPLALALFAALVVARALAWHRYQAAVRMEVLEQAGAKLLQFGTLGALAVGFAGLALPQIQPIAYPLAGLAAVASGWWLKYSIVLRASFNQGFSLPRLPVRGTR